MAGAMDRPLDAAVIRSASRRRRAMAGAALGIVVAGAVHTLKATSRPMINLSTLGVATPLVSAGEDATSLSLSLVAIFLPILVLVGIGLLIWAIIATRRRIRRRRPVLPPSPS